MITAKLKHLKIAPRKVRLAADLIRGMSVIEAQAQLKFLSKRAAHPVLKLLNSALANAEHNFNLSKENLYISKITVDAGPSLKRWLPRAMGRATPILKRTSHITLILEERSKELKKEKSVKKIKEKETIKPMIKKTSEERPKFKRPEKATVQKRGFREVTKKMFRRKSI